MGLLSWTKGLFTSAKTVDTLVSGAVNGIDALIFTDQEKANVSLKTYELWLKMQEVVSQESSIRSITRRIIAVMIMGTFLFLLLFATGVYPISKGYAEFVLSLAKELSSLALAIGCFYFGVHLLRGLTKPKAE